MLCFVTGGAGFIGSNLVDRLLQAGHTVVAYDNFSTGRERFLEQALASPRFKLVRGDALDLVSLVEVLHGVVVIARHPRCYGRGQDVFDPLHYLPLLEQRPGAFNLVGSDSSRLAA